MADTNIRTLERAVEAGEEGAEERLLAERRRAGLVRVLPKRDEPDQVYEQGKTHYVPKIGVGVTTGYGSDRYPGTVVKVSKSGHLIHVRSDSCRVVSGGFQTNDAVVVIESNPDGAVRTYARRYRKLSQNDIDHRERVREAADERGEVLPPDLLVKRFSKKENRECVHEIVWGPRGDTASIGWRDYYQDPSF